MPLKILFASDFHIRVTKPVSRLDTDYLETICNKLSYVCSIAKQADITILGGDIFDAPNCPNSAIIKVIKILSECGSFVHTAVGQHDIWGYSEKSLQSSALGVLMESGCIRKLEPMDIKGVHIHPVHAYDRLHGSAKSSAKLNILVAHKLITDKDMPSSIQISQFHPINQNNIVLSGDMHKPHAVMLDRKLYLNPGSVARQSIDDNSRSSNAAMVTINDDYSFKYDLVPIPCRPGNEVFDLSKYIADKSNELKAENFVKNYASTVMSVKAESYKIGTGLSDFMKQGNVPANIQEMVKKYYTSVEEGVNSKGD